MAVDASHLPLLVVHSILGMPHVVRTVADKAARILFFKRVVPGLVLPLHVKIEHRYHLINHLPRDLGAAILLFFGGYLGPGGQGPLGNRNMA